MHRIPVYRPFYIPEIDADYPGLYGIGCAECGASNGWVQLAYTGGRLIGATVELDRRLAALEMRHEPTRLPRFGQAKRGQKHEPRMRPSPDPVMRSWEAPARHLSTDTGAPSRLWLHCLRCRAGHLVDPVAQLVQSP